MTVVKGKQVSIEYTLTLSDKTEVDTNVGAEPLTYTQGSEEILPALQAALLGLKVGDSKHVTISPDDGYGPLDSKAFMEVDKDRVPDGAHKVGTVLQAEGPGGRAFPVRVHEIKDDSVVLDFNHPLAGKTLVFDVKILKIAESSH